MKICIDTREKYRIQRFQKYINSGKTELIDGIKIGQYDVSDVHTEDMLIGIERKAKDFTPSMFDGRLNQQLKELKDNFVHPFLFIEYEGIKDVILDNPTVNPRAIIGEFASLMARHQIPVLFTGKYDNNPLFVPITVRTIEKFYDGKNPIKNYTPIRQKPSKRKPSIQETKLDIISRIPGIGAGRAVKLLEKFDYSINAISNAPIESITEIKGIGKILANHIKEVLK